MPGWQRAYIASCTGAIAYVLAYVIIDYGQIARPFYDPVGRRFHLASRAANGMAMGYFGMWIPALLVAALLAGAVYALLGRRKKPISERGLGLGLAWTVTVLLLVGGYYTWNNWP